MKFKSYLWSLLTVLAVSLASVGCSDDDDVTPPTPPTPPTPEEKITFEMNVSNITANTADVSVVPSKLDKTYYADIVASVTFAGKTEQEMIDLVLKNSTSDDLMTGKFEMTVSEMNPETEYTLYALAYSDGKVTSEFFTKSFTTLKEESKPEPPQPAAPEIELTSNFNNADNALEFIAKCTSKNAVEAKYACEDSEQFKQIIDAMAGVPVEQIYEQIVTEMGKAMDIEQLNNSSVVISRKDKQPGQKFTCIVLATNENGKTLKNLEAEFTPGTTPEPGDDISSKLEGYLTHGNETGLSTDTVLTAHFSSKAGNLDRCYVALFVRSEMESSIASGKSLEQMILGAPNNTIPGAMIDLINSGQVAHLSFTELTASTEYVFGWLAYDKDKNKGILTSEPLTTTEPNPEEGKGPEVSYMAVSPTNIYGFGADHSASCLLNCREAAKGMVCCIETTEYFELVKTMTPREIIEKHGKELTAEEIGFISKCKLQLVGNFDKLKAETSYRYGAMLFNAAGYPTIMWGDLKTAAPLKHGNDEGCPQVTAEGWAGDKDHKFTEALISIKLQGAEVAGASIINFEAELIHTLFDVGCDAREIIDQMSTENPDFVTYATAEQVEQIKKEGCIFSLGVAASTSYTPIWRCHNAEGKVCVGSFDITTTAGGDPTPGPGPDPDPDPTPSPEGPVTVEVSVAPGDLNGEDTENCINPTVKCTSKNAERCTILMTFKKEVDDKMAAGKSLYDIVMEHPKKEEIRMDWNAGINKEGGCNPGFYHKQQKGEHYIFIAVAWNSKNEHGVGAVAWEFQGAKTESQPVTAAKMAEVAMKNFMKRSTEVNTMLYEQSVDELIMTVTRLDAIKAAAVAEEDGFVFNKLNIKRFAMNF